MKLVFLILASLFTNSVYSQLAINEIDFQRIQQKKIRQYLSEQIKNDRELITDIHPSLNCQIDQSGLYCMENSFLIREPAEVVWKTYNSANMADIWNGRMISFGLLCSKWTDYVLYKNSPDFCTIDTGQVFFINLSILYGIFNLPVGIQVLEIDDENMSITLSYLEGGKSIGIQTIKLTSTPEYYTRVTHTSEFKSNSKIRDKCFYPFYHTKVLNEFHENIALNISSDRTIFYVLNKTNDLNLSRKTP